MNGPVRIGVTKRWSDAVVVGNLAFFVEVPDDPNLSPNEQFVMVLDQVEKRCVSVGTTKRNLVQVLVYLPFAEDLEAFNLIWDSWVPEGCAPSRACTHPALAAPGYRVELVVTAFVPERISGN